MKDLLAPRNRSVLRDLMRQDPLLAFDFDGTLAPLVDDPDAAAMRAGTRHLLAELADRRRVAVISGRAVDDLRPRLEGVAVAAMVGSHGIEPSPEMEPARAAVARWRPLLDARLAGLPGLLIEDKRFSVAIHFRHAPDGAEAAIHDAVDALGGGVRRVAGTSVVNLVPEGMPTKGSALQRLQQATGAATALFVGDEPTDEDAFAVLLRNGGVGIRIGRARGSAARYFVQSQTEIDAVLELLVAAASDAAPGRASDPSDERKHRPCPSQSCRS